MKAPFKMLSVIIFVMAVACQEDSEPVKIDLSKDELRSVVSLMTEKSALKNFVSDLSDNLHGLNESEREELFDIYRSNDSYQLLSPESQRRYHELLIGDATTKLQLSVRSLRLKLSKKYKIRSLDLVEVLIENADIGTNGRMMATCEDIAFDCFLSSMEACMPFWIDGSKTWEQCETTAATAQSWCYVGCMEARMSG